MTSKTISSIMFIIMLAAAGTAQAQINFAGADFFVADSEGYLGSIEYAWESDTRFSGYGYAEAGEEGLDRRFSNHFVDYRFTDWLYLTSEGTAADFGEFVQAGFGLHLGEVPMLKKKFVYLKANFYKNVTGDAGVDQIKLAWMTTSWQSGRQARWSIWSEGFFRFRDGAPHVGQPQIMVSYARLPGIAFGLEPEIFDGDIEIRAGVKFFWVRE